MRRRSCVVATLLGLAAGVIGATPAAAGPVPQKARTCATAGLPTHTVAAGDTWFGISRTYKVSRTSLYEVNDAEESTVIKAGDVLCLPSFATMPAPPTPETTSAPAAASACPVPYTVAAGDSWFRIAKTAGVSVTALLAVNGADADRALHPGAALCLPAGAAPAAAAPSTTTTTTTTATAPAAASCAGSSYTVVKDDSWFQIAQRAETSMSALLDANDSTDRTVLQPGEVLCLPKNASPPAASQLSGALAALPLQGPCWFGDTWQAPRGGERRHEGIDLIASSGQYIYAVADGILTGRAWDQPGLRAGNAWWLRATDGSGTKYFYAHMSAFADDLTVGSTVRAGQIIGFVGETGNAGGPHLHFEIHPQGGAAINPYPIVKPLGGCNKDTPYVQPGGWTPS